MELFLQNLSVGRRSFDDPFFEDGDKACGMFNRMCVFDIDDEELCHEISKEFCCEVPGCTSTFDTLIEFDIHYNTLHRYVCSVCHKSLPSPHFLDLHIQEYHDSYFSLQAERKPMYQCFVENCKTKFQTPEERKHHCLKTHSFPPNFRWFVKDPPKQKSKSSKPKPKKIVDAEMKEESLHSAAAESVMEEDTGISQQMPKKQKPRKKRADKSVEMDTETEKSASPAEAQKDTHSEKSCSNPKTMKNPAPFRGFIPRNVTANRAFFQKSYFKGRDWHQNASSSNTATSVLENSSISADLRDSLPTEMEES